MMTNENIHTPSKFNPQDYEVADYLDNQRPRLEWLGAKEMELEMNAWERHIARYFPTCAAVRKNQGPQLPEHNIHRCRHCGNTNVRYIVAVLHKPTGQYIVFGNECVERLNFPNRDAFKAEQVRARAEAGNARLRIWHARQEFLSTRPELAKAIETIADPVHKDNTFAHDVIGKLNQYGSLSERQVAAVLNSLHQDKERGGREERRAQEKAQLIASGVTAPVGRVAVEGEVLSTRVDEGPYGAVCKWLVKLTNGTKVWSSVPASLAGENLRGSRVRFTATFEHSKDDPTFAFGSRPSKAELLA